MADGRTDMVPAPNGDPFTGTSTSGVPNTGLGANDGLPLPVGERLRAARELRRLSLDDVATQTRVPMRHLEAIETSDWSGLPAPTYSIGFAKSYAEVVGLDRQAVGDDLRAEMGGSRAANAAPTFEPADPARVPPRTLAWIALVVAALLLAGYGYYRTATLGDVQPRIVDDIAATSAPDASAPGAAAAPSVAAVAGPVVITANEEVWIRVYERGGATLNEDILKAGESYEVPAASDPLLRTSRAELLRISVGTADAPPIGPPATLVKDVSLKPAALMGSTPAAAPGAPTR